MTTNCIQPNPPEPRSADDWQALADHISGTFVVLVMAGNNRYVRRCFMTIKAAQTAARRARERGQSSTVVLSELRPLYHLPANREDGAA